MSQQRATRDISGRKCFVPGFAMFFLPTQFNDQGIIFRYKLLQEPTLGIWSASRDPSLANSFSGFLGSQDICITPHLLQPSSQGLFVPLL